MRATGWTAVGASVRGASHVTSGQRNQDAVRLSNPSPGHEFLALAVSDGHGSLRSFRSERGSVLAAESAVRVLGQFVRRLGPFPSLSVVRRQAVNLWPGAMIEAWKAAVRADVLEHPFSPLDFAAYPEKVPALRPGEELPATAYLAYGATLVAVAITPRYMIYSQLGDGDILAVHADGRVSRPLPRQHEFMANQTKSLCTRHASREFQVRVVPVRANAPALITLSTDGYANCFGNEEGFFKVGADIFNYLGSDGLGFVAEKLEEWLGESSRYGSGDDITVGLAARSHFLRRPDAS